MLLKLRRRVKLQKRIMLIATNKGQSLFELIVAVAFISLVVLAVIGLATKSIDNSSFSRNRTLASRYTQSAVEWLRSQRDNDWNAFASRAQGGRTWCLRTLTSFNNPGPCGSGEYVLGTNNFWREAILDYNPGPPPRVEATVITSWRGSSDKIHESRATTVFTNWKAE